MKNKHLILLLLILTYSVLFFHQEYGWNILFIAVLLPLAQWSYYPPVIRNKHWLGILTGYIISCVAVAINGSIPAITAFLISITALSTAVVAPGTTIFTGILWTFFSAIGSFFINVVDQFPADQKMERRNPARFNLSIILSTLVPVLLIILFFTLYRSANAVFDWFVRMIDLEILSPQGLFFILLSGIVFYGIIKFSPLLNFFNYENHLSVEVDQDKEGKLFSSGNLYTAGVSSLILLNLLILLLNSFDISFLMMGARLPEDLTWSDLVHQGIGSLITSLVFAVIILFFFIRGSVYRHKNYKVLLILAGIWLFQNSIMVFLNYWKNHLYIDEFGLTGKRIGVDIYLLLALTGLTIAFLQVSRKKTALFMFQKFGWSAWILLVICSLVNWPVFIANYNIRRTFDHNKTLDVHYLYELGDNVLPLLLEYNIRVRPDNNSGGGYSYSNQRYDLERRTENFIERYENTSWRSKNYRMDRTYLYLTRK